MRRVLAVLLCVGLAACDSKSDSGGQTTNGGGGGGGVQVPDEGLIGKVTDLSGAPLGGVTVTGGGATATTGADGTYTLDAKGDLVVGFDKAGYVHGIKRTTVAAGTASRLDATMARQADAKPLDATAGGSVDGERGSKVTVPAGALVDAAGNVVTGQVDVHLTPLDPSVPAELAAYPGDLRAVDAQGGTVQLESFGVVDVTIRQNGQELDVKEGMALSLVVPAPEGTTNRPDTVGLWSFTEETGLWKEEGTATYVAAEDAYHAEIPHLSPWNCDQPMETTCLRGKVVDETGAPVVGSQVLTSGVDYAGQSSAVTDASGQFCVPVRIDSTVRVTATHPAGGGTQVEVTSGGTIVTVPPACDLCQDIGTLTVQSGSVTGPRGETVDCSDLPNPFAGTCGEGFRAMFECFAPSGACVIRAAEGGGTETAYANGSKVVTKVSGTTGTGTFYGPTGTVCGTFETEGTSADLKITYTTTGGQSFAFEQRDTGWAIVCPNGQEVLLSSAEADAYQACQGGGQGGAEGQCTYEGGGGFPGSCSTSTDCDGGKECCPTPGGNFCLPPEECASAGGCQTDADCDSGTTCCQLGTGRACLESAQCDKVCTADAECTGDEVCCSYVTYSMCTPKASCFSEPQCTTDADCQQGSKCCTVSGYVLCYPGDACP